MSDDWVFELQTELRIFAEERGWERYHVPRNLAALIASEAGELLALFRWDQNALAEKPEEVQGELADVLLGILRFADVTAIDLRNACAKKIALNRERYPPGGTGPDRI